MLSINNLYASVDGKEILKGVNLELGKGQIHVIMGENGSGKSTLSLVLAGHPRYNVSQGNVMFEDKELLQLTPGERAKNGLFLSLQHPPEIEGVRLARFLQESLKAVHPETSGNVLQMQQQMKLAVSEFGFPEGVLQRSLNLGFSGGEKKKMELFQLSLLKPKLAILDEFDSGLDIDALKSLSAFLKRYLQENPESSLLLITHYSKIFEYLKPDKVHVMMDGKIVKSGGVEIAALLEEKGYGALK